MKIHHPTKCPRAQAWDTDAPCCCPAGWPRHDQHLIRIPCYAARIATAALMAVLLAVALAGCTTNGDPTAMQDAATFRLAAEELCTEMGGEVHDASSSSFSSPTTGGFPGSAFAGVECRFDPLSAREDEPTRFRPDYHPPAEDPEGGTP